MATGPVGGGASSSSTVTALVLRSSTAGSIMPTTPTLDPTWMLPTSPVAWLTCTATAR